MKTRRSPRSTTGGVQHAFKRPLLAAYLFLAAFQLQSYVFSSHGPSVEAAAGGTDDRRRRVAIIGGGISGTFTAKYLAEYDARSNGDDGGGCRIGSLTVFDAPAAEGGQGSRISSLALDKDGSVVELGASIIYDGNKLAKEVVDSDPDLVPLPPHSSGGDEKKDDEEDGAATVPSGFGMWDGDKFVYSTSKITKGRVTTHLLYRYNLDLIRLSRAVTRAVKSFDRVYMYLDDTDDVRTYFRSPDELWDAVGLLGPSRITFDDLLDTMGITRTVPAWRSFLPGQGVLRNELVTSANLSNYNQNNTQLNGLAGLVSFVPTKGELFCVKGGNDQIPSSALKQAQAAHNGGNCSDGDKKEDGTIRMVQEKVTSVVATEDEMELFDAKGESLGTYDYVVLAAPLQFCQTEFFLQSPADDAVLSALPLRTWLDDEEGGENTTPSTLLTGASRTYQQTITTVVRNAMLQVDHFNATEDELPRSVYLTDEGKRIEGISSITQLTANGVYKMFSTEELSLSTLHRLFGKDCEVVTMKVWGGRHGGAYPSFEGGQGDASKSLPFVLYDGGARRNAGGSSASSKGIEGPVLYYTNTMETAVAAIEISAIGAKAVAKLLAWRMGIIGPSEGAGGAGEEL